VDIPATSSNIPGTLVLRDNSGNLSAGTVAANITGALTGNVTGDLTGNVTGNVTGNSSTATALQTSRTIELTGDVTGSASFNGTANASITANIGSGVVVDADISATAAIAGSKLADGAITDAKVDAAAAIAGTKIAPDFGSQAVTAGDGKVVINSSGQIIGGTSTAFDSTASIQLTADSSSAPNANIVLSRNTNAGTCASLRFEKARGSLASKTVAQSGDPMGLISFFGFGGTSNVFSADIRAVVDGTPGTNDMPGRLVFATTAGGASTPTERMRLTSSGDLLIGKTVDDIPTVGIVLGRDGRGRFSQQNGVPIAINRNTNGQIQNFRRSDAQIGSISVTTTATAFNTTSDYRLKQNIEPMVGGLAKLSALTPKTFEFKAEPDVKVDGFIAHEVQAVVPQAVTGEKDGEEMQGMDHSKLVPVLVAAVQELSAKVAALESALELK